MKIIAIIPAYNEENTITGVISEVKKHIKEIIVIDDGSTDSTIKTAEMAGARVVKNIVNRGLGITVRRGYKEALKAGADIVVQIDADGQYTAEDIPRLIAPIRAGEADMVLASRVKGGIEKMSFGKRFGNKIGTLVTRLVSGYNVSDAQTGFRAMRRELLEEIIPYSKYTYVQEMIIKTARSGWRIKEIPSFFKKRTSGKSRLLPNIFSYAKKAVIIILRTLRDYNPLLFFGAVGSLLFVFGIGFGWVVLYKYFETGVMSKPGTALLSAVLMIFGSIMVFLGILADMIKMKHEELEDKIRDLKK